MKSLVEGHGDRRSCADTRHLGISNVAPGSSLPRLVRIVSAYVTVPSGSEQNKRGRPERPTIKLHDTASGYELPIGSEGVVDACERKAKVLQPVFVPRLLPSLLCLKGQPRRHGVDGGGDRGANRNARRCLSRPPWGRRLDRRSERRTSAFQAWGLEARNRIAPFSMPLISASCSAPVSCGGLGSVVKERIRSSMLL